MAIREIMCASLAGDWRRWGGHQCHDQMFKQHECIFTCLCYNTHPQMCSVCLVVPSQWLFDRSVHPDGRDHAAQTDRQQHLWVHSAVSVLCFPSRFVFVTAANLAGIKSWWVNLFFTTAIPLSLGKLRRFIVQVIRMAGVRLSSVR